MYEIMINVLRQTAYELMKFFKIKKGYILIILFIIVNAAGALNNNVKSSKYSDEEEALLKFYYEKWGNTYDSANDTMINLYYSMVTSDDYDIETDTVIPEDIREQIIDEKEVKDMMTVYYSSYNIAKNNEHTNVIADSRGWHYLFIEYKNINMFLCIITLIISSIIFSADKGKGIEDIVKCTRNGKRKLLPAKIIAVIIMVVVIELIRTAALFPVINTYGISYFSDIPIQNVNYMQDTAVNIGTRQAMAFLILCEIAGLIYVSLITGIIIISNYGKAEGFICGIIAAYVPFFLLNKNNGYMKAALPSAFLAPYNFLSEINMYRLQYILTVVIIIGIMFIMEAVYTHEKSCS